MREYKITPKELILESILLLKKNKIKEPKLNAELIMSHCMNGDRIYLYENYTKKLTKIEQNLFRTLIRRRIKHEPVQYIIGKTEFMGLPFKLNKNVLIPRPETETLVEFAINYSLENKEKCKKILDLGTGSGNIIISLAKYSPNLKYYAVDISRGALYVAKENAILNKVDKFITFFQCDLFSCFNKKFKFDMILTNPPYIPQKVLSTLPEEIKLFEPQISIDGGEDGLKLIKRIIYESYKYLNKNGICLMEIGYDQSYQVGRILRESEKYKDIKFIKDLARTKRVVFFKRK